jgi:hypothetical protein
MANFIKNNLGKDSAKLMITVGTPSPVKGEKKLNEGTMTDYAGKLTSPQPTEPVTKVPTGDTVTTPSGSTLFKK